MGTVHAILIYIFKADRARMYGEGLAQLIPFLFPIPI